VTLTLQDLPAHGYVKLSFDLFIIRSWDGDSRPSPPGSPSGPGPDIWSLTADLGLTLLYATFDNHHMEPYVGWHRQSYPQEYPDGDLLPQSGAAEKNTLGYQHDFPTGQSHNVDSVYRLTFTFPHLASRLDIDFAASGLQPLTDESWGLDNVRVEIAGPDVELPAAFRDPQLKACIEAHLGVTDPTPTDMLASTELACTGNDIFDLTGLEYAVNLTYLDLSGNQIMDISALQGLKLLETLNLMGNPLKDDAYTTHIPQILAKNPGIELLYDPPLIAWNPFPPDGALHPDPWVFGGWSAGVTAVSHDVYFGDDFAEVDADAGTGETFQSNQPEVFLVVGVPGYPYPDGLVPGTTYYWRVDEVEADGTKHKGQVWSFRVLLGLPINQPEMGSSLGEIGFRDPEVFAEQVQRNNFQHPQNPEYDRVHVELVEGLEPDPAGMMRMRNLKELDPASPTFGRTVPARAKGAFDEHSAERILVRFAYLFERSAPGLELVAYLSDVPELLDHDDPLRAEHYIEIGRVPMPPAGRPGSVGSGRFGIFEQRVSTGSLDLSNGTWVELEFVEPALQSRLLSSFHGGIRLASSDASSGDSALIDDWAVEVHCDGICMDLNWSDAADEEDFLLVLASCGSPAALLEGGVGSRACLDGLFSTDGFVDSFDIVSWDWALSDPDRAGLLNFCQVPLSGSTSIMMNISAGSFEGSDGSVSLMSLPDSLSDLLIAGKRATSEDPTALKSKDRLYAFDSSGQYIEWSDPESDRCNVRLVKGPEGELYQVNCETGVLRLDGPDEVIVPPGQVTYANEPRYNKSATVYIGIQNEDSDPFGRPILDAAFDADYVYVVPVVVSPYGEEAYAAAAKLQLLVGAGNPPYEVVQLYDDPPPAADNQHRNNLREIEIDSAGNLYVLNVHALNESDILWKYDPNGTIKRLDLGNPNNSSYVPDPIAMHISDSTDMLYLTSAQYNQPDVNATVVHGFSTDETLELNRSVTINNMQHVTGITEDPITATLWAVGFNMEDIPESPDPTQPPFYHPCLAKIPYGSDNPQVTALLGSHDLGLPMSIVWTATADECGGADLNQSGSVDFSDFAILAQYWLDSNCSPSDWCAGADFNENTEIDFVDFAIMAEYWLETGCSPQ
jgi:hypothetical protein